MCFFLIVSLSGCGRTEVRSAVVEPSRAMGVNGEGNSAAKRKQYGWSITSQTAPASGAVLMDKCCYSAAMNRCSAACGGWWQRAEQCP